MTLWRVRRLTLPLRLVVSADSPPGATVRRPRLCNMDTEAIAAACRAPPVGSCASVGAAAEISSQLRTVVDQEQQAASEMESVAVAARIIVESVPAASDAEELLSQMSNGRRPAPTCVDGEGCRGRTGPIS